MAHSPDVTLSIIKYPLSTEKAIRQMESENKMVFIVQSGVSRQVIRQAIETGFNAKVVSVNLHTMKGQRRAYVKFADETPAIDIATKLGIM
ncbi:50S ribosomal protein L23 [Candidatus Woesearchaeota archaeon CG_4_10_14_0_2_um_filter_57_5]|nr:MAG: 50S ribosomal protein L23 [Candidatus Woesearchaeota archaeon CG1_02_57_44]PIN70395.1 MAG: 50S ribosomal protein L23 [Candidatus Woesearchaeota archaeon CG11_big_fil_rev_8_21_14_0_20_57_5]PIZ52807.1 MAG: 50S ribosomal protein L23 [Candidatus Woesearchaeota archaeon CG_4_10_14_0_2_um_filter_57_5]